MMAMIEGGCACRQVQYRCAAEPVVAAFCQCRACQFDSGAGHSAHLGVPADAVTLDGNLTWWETKAASGNTSSRAFCPVCGASIAFKSNGMPDLLFLTAGSLDDPNQFRPQMVVFAGNAPAWDRIDPSLPHYTGMPER